MAKVGRNAPCPCGSGKKYKKCCLAKDEAESREPRATPPEKPSHPGVHCCGCHEQDDGRPMPPYVAARLLEYPEVFEQTVRAHGVLRTDQWTPSKLEAMSTEEIENRLRDVGVDPAPERFIELAEGHTSAWELSRVWLRDMAVDELTGEADDFLGLAACEIWTRLCPHRPSIEMLDDWMQEGYHFAQEEMETTACDKWLELWRILRKRLTPQMRTTEDAEGLVSGTQCLYGWIQDFGDALRMAALDDPQFAELGIETLSEILDRFPDEEPEDRVHLRTEVAQLHYLLGRDEEGERLFVELIQDEPDEPEGWASFADELAFTPTGSNEPRDFDRAIRVLEQATNTLGLNAQSWDIDFRLAELREEQAAGLEKSRRGIRRLRSSRRRR